MRELLTRAREVVAEEGGRRLLVRAGRWARYRYELFACERFGSAGPGAVRRVRVAGRSVRLYEESAAECRMIAESARTEVPVVRRFVDALRPGDVLWDVGSNIGFYSCLAAAHGAAVDVHAFDPHPRNAERTRENVALNGGSAAVFEVALSDSNGPVEFDPVVADTPGHGGSHVVAGDGGGSGSVEVRAVTGESLVADGRAARPTVVKLDVEGAELDVLEGMGAALDDCRVLFVEVHRTAIREFGATPEAVDDHLRDRGFALERIHDRGGEATYHLLARTD